MQSVAQTREMAPLYISLCCCSRSRVVLLSVHLNFPALNNLHLIYCIVYSACAFCRSQHASVCLQTTLDSYITLITSFFWGGGDRWVPWTTIRLNIYEHDFLGISQRDVLLHNQLLAHCAGRPPHVQMNMFARLHLWHVLRLMMTDHCKYSLNAQHTQAWGDPIVRRAWIVFQTHNNSQTDDFFWHLNKICVPQKHDQILVYVIINKINSKFYALPIW